METVAPKRKTDLKKSKEVYPAQCSLVSAHLRALSLASLPVSLSGAAVSLSTPVSRPESFLHAKPYTISWALGWVRGGVWKRERGFRAGEQGAI